MEGTNGVAYGCRWGTLRRGMILQQTQFSGASHGLGPARHV